MSPRCLALSKVISLQRIAHCSTLRNAVAKLTLELGRPPSTRLALEQRLEEHAKKEEKEEREREEHAARMGQLVAERDRFAAEQHKWVSSAFFHCRRGGKETQQVELFPEGGPSAICEETSLSLSLGESSVT